MKKMKQILNKTVKTTDALIFSIIALFAVILLSLIALILSRTF